MAINTATMILSLVKIKINFLTDVQILLLTIYLSLSHKHWDQTEILFHKCGVNSVLDTVWSVVNYSHSNDWTLVDWLLWDTVHIPIQPLEIDGAHHRMTTVTTGFQSELLSYQDKTHFPITQVIDSTECRVTVIYLLSFTDSRAHGEKSSSPILY